MNFGNLMQQQQQQQQQHAAAAAMSSAFGDMGGDVPLDDSQYGSGGGVSCTLVPGTVPGTLQQQQQHSVSFREPPNGDNDPDGGIGVAGDAKTPTRKRRHSSANDELYRHFHTLDEKLVTRNGKPTNHYLCICRYCQDEYDMAVANSTDGQQLHLQPPRKFMRSKRYCENHLKTCTAFKRFDVAGQGIPGSVLGPGAIPATEEEEDEAAAAAAIAAEEAEPKTKKRRMHWSLAANQDLYRHFNTLDEKLVTGKGKPTNHYLCLCLYCQDAYDKAMKVWKLGMPHPEEPRRFMRSRRYCENHLKQCQNYKRFLSENEEGTPPPGADTANLVPIKSADMSSSSTLRAAGKKTGPGRKPSLASIPAAVGRGAQNLMPPGATQQLERQLIEMVVDNDLPYNIVERASFRRFVAAIRPMADQRLPGRHKLKETLLRDRAEQAKGDLLKTIQAQLAKGHLSGLMIQTRRFCSGNSSTQAISPNEGSLYIEGLLLKTGDASFALDTTNIRDSVDMESHGIAVARSWENILVQEQILKYDIRYCLSDDVTGRPCQRARGILALRHPFMLWIRCWAYQINAFVSTLLLQSESLKLTCEMAIGAAKAINGGKASQWMNELHDNAEAMYGGLVSKRLYTVDKSRWSSMQACFASQLRMVGACRDLASAHAHNVPDFPQACATWNSDSYWFKLKEAEMLLRPFCDASYLLQRDRGNTLAHVMLVFLQLCEHIQAAGGAGTGTGSRIYSSDNAKAIMKRIEKCWEQQDNPLYFLAFALHPSFRNVAVQILKKSQEADGNWSKSRNALSVARLATAAKFYYGKHRLFKASSDDGKEEEAADLGKDICQWMLGKDLTMNKCRKDENVVEWWQENSDEYPELARLAMFLLDCPIQTASCEELLQESTRPISSIRGRSGGGGGRRRRPAAAAASKEPAPPRGDPTAYQRVVVKQDIERKYKDDVVAGIGRHRKNRLLLATEYLRLDAARQRFEEGDRREDGSFSRDGRDKRESERAEEEALLVDEETDGRGKGGTSRMRGDENHYNEVEHWMDVLQRASAPTEAEVMERGHDRDNIKKEEEEDDEGNNSEEKEVGGGDSGNDSAGEFGVSMDDSYEVAPADLPPLPEEDHESYPAENSRYFAKKKYVRKDKYSLQKMLREGIELPPLSLFYGHHNG